MITWPPTHVHGDVERAPVLGQRAAEHAFDRVGAAQQREAVAERVDRLAAEQGRGRLADQRRRIDVEEIADIGRDAGDQPVGRDDSRKPIGWIAPSWWMGSRSQLVRSTWRR